MKCFALLLSLGLLVQAQDAPPAAPAGRGAPGGANAGAAAGGGNARGAGGGAAAGGNARAAGGGGRVLHKLIVDPDLGYKPVPNPLPMPAGLAYGAVAGVVLNSAEHIFVYMGVRPDQKLNNVAFGPLVEFDQNGKYLRTFGQELQVGSPHGIRIDSANNIWITDIGNHLVTKVNPKGEVLIRLGTRDKSGVWDEAAGNRTFNQPTDLALAKNGDVFVGQGHGGGGANADPRILRFDKNGKFITSWSGKVQGPAAFTNVHAVTLDPDGNVWVGDRGANKILIFDPSGTYLRSIEMPVYVCGFYVHEGKQLYMTSGWDGQILKMDWDGKITGATGGPGEGLNKYGEAELIAINSRGEIFVADKVNDVVQKLVRK